MSLGGGSRGHIGFGGLRVWGSEIGEAGFQLTGGLKIDDRITLLVLDGP